jgi:hypothetical protein
LRVTINDEMVRTQAYRDEPSLLADLESWRTQFVDKGWQP